MPMHDVGRTIRRRPVRDRRAPAARPVALAARSAGTTRAPLRWAGGDSLGRAPRGARERGPRDVEARPSGARARSLHERADAPPRRTPPRTLPAEDADRARVRLDAAEHAHRARPRPVHLPGTARSPRHPVLRSAHPGVVAPRAPVRLLGPDV